MDIKQLVDNACLVWEENGFYKRRGVLLFSDEIKETAEAILTALNGYNFYTAATILEACKMALKQAPICLETEKPPLGAIPGRQKKKEYPYIIKETGGKVKYETN